MKLENLPEPEFKEEIGGFSVYLRKDIYAEEYLRELGLNKRQVKSVMYVKEKKIITNKEYQQIKCKKEKQLTNLKSLKIKGIFQKMGKLERKRKYYF